MNLVLYHGSCTDGMCSCLLMHLYFKTIKELNIVAPVTLHVEYPLLNAEEEKQSLIEKQKIMVPKIRHDIDFLRSYLNKYEIQ